MIDRTLALLCTDLQLDLVLFLRFLRGCVPDAVKILLWRVIDEVGVLLSC